jgi:hypothetical protein
VLATSNHKNGIVAKPLQEAKLAGVLEKVSDYPEDE